MGVRQGVAQGAARPEGTRPRGHDGRARRISRECPGPPFPSTHTEGPDGTLDEVQQDPSAYRPEGACRTLAGGSLNKWEIKGASAGPPRPPRSARELGKGIP